MTTKAEKETLIQYTQAEDKARVDTMDRSLMRRLEKLSIVPEVVEVDDHQRVLRKEYSVPRSWVRVRPPRTATTAQREAARQVGLRHQKGM